MPDSITVKIQINKMEAKCKDCDFLITDKLDKWYTSNLLNHAKWYPSHNIEGSLYFWINDNLHKRKIFNIIGNTLFKNQLPNQEE